MDLHYCHDQVLYKKEVNREKLSAAHMEATPVGSTPKWPVDPHDMDGSAARLLHMFDDLGYVVTLLRKVQNENARLLRENAQLTNRVNCCEAALKRLASRDVWRP